MTKNTMKKQAAEAALAYVQADSIIGIGSGSTVNCFIELLGTIKHKVEGAVAASEESAKRLRAQGVDVLELNDVNSIPVYVDGADEINRHMQMIKGGGAALTREKIIAAAAKTFVCIAAGQEKKVDILGTFPLPIEVIPMARSYVAREIVKLGGDPEYRAGVITDNGNVILDIHHFKLIDPVAIESKLNNIAGVVSNGIFARRPADVLLLATSNGVETLG